MSSQLKKAIKLYEDLIKITTDKNDLKDLKQMLKKTKEELNKPAFNAYKVKAKVAKEIGFATKKEMVSFMKEHKYTPSTFGDENVFKKTVSSKLNMKKQLKDLQKLNYDVSNKLRSSKHNFENALVEAKERMPLKLNKIKENDMFKKQGMAIDYDVNKLVNANEHNVDDIARLINQEYSKAFTLSNVKYPQGSRIVLKILFRVNENFISVSMQNDINLLSIKQQITNNIINRHHDAENDYMAVFAGLTVFIFGLGAKGGCANEKHIEQKIKCDNRTLKLISPKSKNNNCLFMCFAYFLKLKGNQLNFEKIRKELGLSEKDKISFKDISKVADYFKTSYVLINEKTDIISFKNLDNTTKVHIMLKNDHYYIVETLEYKKCGKCGKKLRFENDDHVCNITNISYYNSKICELSNMVRVFNKRDDKVIDDDSMIFFDLETFQDGLKHVPYACGYCIGNQEVKISYGKNCMDGLINLLMTCENKTICAFNGSGFDFYLLADMLSDKRLEINDLINANGNILKFTFGKGNKVFDLYRFINSSLENACDAYKIENAKMKFDVLKIQSWADSEKYRNEVEPYLKYDVLSLRELFFTFNNSVFAYDQINITNYVTISNMAYALWTRDLKYMVELPDLEKYDFIKKGTYGARCYPQQKFYKSKHYDNVINKEMSYEELKKSGEYIYNADATSLYPASMAGFDLCEVKYPTGQSRWSKESEKEFNNGMIGYYSIKFQCPKIRIPVLPRKKNDNGLEWSLTDGEGVYTNVDIENAKKHGYIITFNDKCLVWDSHANVFKNYITRYYNMKSEADKEKNEVKRSIAKLMCNAMYGKTMQRAIFETTTIVNNYNQLLDILRENEISNIGIMNEDKLLVTYKFKNKEKQITKPCQLGGFVLAYSRRIMLNYFEAIDPSLQTMIFTYTDTDSMHILGKHAEKLKELGYIKSKEDAKLGYLCNDIKNEGIIMNECNLAPKTYFYEYITNDNKIHDKEKGTVKCKGIPKKSKIYNKETKTVDTVVCLKYEMYTDYVENNKCTKVEFSGLKRKHKNLTRKDKENGLGHFSIVNNIQTRTFMNSEWKGMNYKNNEWYCNGY
jgi:hypothetical protein